MEYQDYEISKYERWEKDLEEVQEGLVSRRQAMAQAGISVFEGNQELDFANYLELNIKCSGDEAKAKCQKGLAQRKLRFAEQKLQAAESDDLGERVERAMWDRLFLKEVESAQIRLEGLQHLAENAKRDFEPFKLWFQASQIEWAKERGKAVGRS